MQELRADPRAQGGAEAAVWRQDSEVCSSAPDPRLPAHHAQVDTVSLFLLIIFFDISSNILFWSRLNIF